MKKLLLVLLLCLLATPAAATVNETVARNDYTGNGTTTAFPYTFRIIVKEALQVYLGTTLQVLDVAYNVTGVGNSAGTVVFLTPPPANAHITILRKQAKQQTSVYQPNEAFPAKRIETDYDKNMMADQQQEEEIGRALKFYPYSLNKDVWVEDPINGKCLQWSTAAGNFIVTSGNCAGGGGGGGGGGNVSGSGIKGQNTFWTDTSEIGSTNRETYVGAFGTTRQAIQDAIDATGNSGIVHLECLTYTLDGITLAINKPLTFQGCQQNASYPPDASIPTTILQSPTGSTVITIDTPYGVMLRDFASQIGSGAGSIGTHILITGTPANAFTKIERLSLYYGTAGIIGDEGKVFNFTARDNWIWKPTTAGIVLGGYQSGSNNCDGGAYTLINNNLLGSATGDGLLFNNSAAVSLIGNNVQTWQNSLHIRVGLSSICTGPGPSQWQVVGNQFDVGGASGGHSVFMEIDYGTGYYAFGENVLGTTGGDDDAFRVIIGASGGIFALNINNNNFVNVGKSSVHISGVAGGIVGSTISNNTLAFGGANPAVNIENAAYGVTVANNSFLNPLPAQALFVGASYTIVSLFEGGAAQTLATLPAAISGSLMWCVDCFPTNACTAGGTGAFARREGSAWNCGPPGATAIADHEIVVGTGTGLTGYTDFLWNDVTSTLTAGSAPPTLSGTVAALLSLFAGNSVFDGTSGTVAFNLMFDTLAPVTLSLGSSHNAVFIGNGGTITNSGGTFVGAVDGFTVADSADTALLASFQPSVTNSALRTAVIGAQSASIDGSTNAVILGGLSGSITGAANAVSLNGGVVATNATTAVGGTRFDVTYLGGAGVQCLQADNNGTIQASGAACGGGGLAIPATQIVVGSGPSVASFSDFTWNETDQTLNAGANTIGAATINSNIIGSFNTTQAASNQNFIFGRNNLGSVGGQDIIIGQFNDASTNTGGFGGLFGDSNSATVLATGTCYSWGSTNVCDTATASNFGHGNTASGLGGAENHGQNNITTGADAYSFGFTITNSGDNCVVLGQVISCTHAGATVIGQGTNSVANNSISLGVLPTPEVTITAGITSVANTDNGASANIKVLTEELTILAAANTDTSVQFPAGSTSLGCTVRVTTVIPTAVTFDTGVAGATTRYATGTSTALNSTGGTAVFAPYATATSVRITPNTSPGAATGTVRVTCPYIDVTPATS